MPRLMQLDPEVIADISGELAKRKHPDMSDEEIMYQLGLSTRAVYDRTPPPRNRDLLSDCATEVAKREIGLDRALVVAESGKLRERANGL